MTRTPSQSVLYWTVNIVGLLVIIACCASFFNALGVV